MIELASNFRFLPIPKPLRSRSRAYHWQFPARKSEYSRPREQEFAVAAIRLMAFVYADDDLSDNDFADVARVAGENPDSSEPTDGCSGLPAANSKTKLG